MRRRKRDYDLLLHFCFLSFQDPRDRLETPPQRMFIVQCTTLLLSKLIKQWNFHLVHVIFGHERREIGKLGSPLL